MLGIFIMLGIYRGFVILFGWFFVIVLLIRHRSVRRQSFSLIIGNLWVREHSLLKNLLGHRLSRQLVQQL